MVVTYYIKLFRTRADRHNGILMSTPSSNRQSALKVFPCCLTYSLKKKKQFCHAPFLNFFIYPISLQPGLKLTVFAKSSTWRISKLFITQRRIKNLVKRLRWSFCENVKDLKPLFSQNTQSKMLDSVLNTPLHPPTFRPSQLYFRYYKVTWMNIGPSFSLND